MGCMMKTIRMAEREDASILSAIQTEAFLPLWEKYHDQDNPCLRGEQDITDRLHSTRFRYFCILQDSLIVGGILYSRHGEGWYLQRVYIKPDCQGKGIASAAILLCEHELEDAQVFTVDFPQDMQKNRRCYSKAGFTDTGMRIQTESGIILARFEKRLPS